MTRNARTDAEVILRAAIAAADPAPRVQHALAHAPELASAATVHVLAVGKAACRMHEGARQYLAAAIARALVVAPPGVDCDGALHAAHPLPDDSSVHAALAARALIEAAPPDALLLVLLSGGASALLALPMAGIDIGSYAACVRLLQRAGADIHELNTVRKHIDALKGGRFGILAAPRPTLGLILSDVIGDPVDVIASGPLTPDPSTFADAIAVLQRRGVWEACAAEVRAALQSGAGDRAQETPADAAQLAHVRTDIIGGNTLARRGAADAARALGYRVVEQLEPIVGEARVAAHALVARVRELQRALESAAAPVCLVAGGETTVTVRGSGRGGRNQELVLAAALALEETSGITIGSIGTDGIDGTSDAAGAIADSQTTARARSLGLEPLHLLERNDSDAFFRAAGGQLMTGATGTNVMDVQVALIPPRA